MYCPTKEKTKLVRQTLTKQVLTKHLIIQGISPGKIAKQYGVGHMLVEDLISKYKLTNWKDRHRKHEEQIAKKIIDKKSLVGYRPVLY